MNKKIIISAFIFVILIIAFIILISVPEERNTNEPDWNELERLYEYKQSTKRLIDETGIPEDNTCEQINIMIKTEIYPIHEQVYECKSSEESNYSWCETHSYSNTKEMFVKYYLTECLEQKKDFALSGDEGK